MVRKNNSKAIIDLGKSFNVVATEIINETADGVQKRLEIAQTNMKQTIKSWGHKTVNGNNGSIYSAIIISDNPKKKSTPKAGEVPTKLYLRVKQPQLKKAEALEFGVAPHYTNIGEKAYKWAINNTPFEGNGPGFWGRGGNYIVFVGGKNSKIKKGNSERQFWEIGIRAAFPKGIDAELNKIAQSGAKKGLYNLERRIKKLNK